MSKGFKIPKVAVNALFVDDAIKHGLKIQNYLPRVTIILDV